MQNTEGRLPLLPILGWGEFPSQDIPNMLNWGHMYVFLVENAPNWIESLDLPPDDDDDDDDEELAGLDVGRANITNKALRFLASDHVLEIVDAKAHGFYFVKARVKASMRQKVYFVTATFSCISGSVQDCTCTCKQRALGRCSHTAAVLLGIARHISEEGYEGIYVISVTFELQ